MATNTSTGEYKLAVTKFISEANRIFSEFLSSEEGKGFSGQVVLVGDSIGAIMAYDALCVSPDPSSVDYAMDKRASSDGSINVDIALAQESGSEQGKYKPVNKI